LGCVWLVAHHSTLYLNTFFPFRLHDQNTIGRGDTSPDENHDLGVMMWNWR
jgi:hypothetical protein